MFGSFARRWRARAVVLLAPLALVYLPLAQGQVVYHRDVVRFVYPARWFVRDAIQRGELPFWNAHEGLGFSVLGDPQYGLFYPPSWLLLLPGPLPQMLSWFSFGHLAFAALGCAYLAELLGADAVGSLCAGSAFALCGYTNSVWTTGVLLNASAWIPWCAAASVCSVRARGSRARVRAAAIAALPVALSFLLGEVFMSVLAVGFGALIACAYQASVAPEDEQNARGWARALAGLAGAACLGAGLAAVALIPAASFAATTARAAPLELQYAEQWSLHPLRSSELLLPGVFGLAWQARPRTALMQRLVGDMPFALSIYAGASVVALALFSLGRRRRLSTWLGLLCLLSLLTSLGSWTPVHSWLRGLVPPLSYMRNPEKYLILVVTALSLLAGLGATRMRTGAGGRPWRRLALLCFGLVTLLPWADALFTVELGARARAAALHASVAVLALLGVARLMRERSGLGAVLLPCVVAVDLATALLPFQHFGEPRRVAGRPALADMLSADKGAGGSDPVNLRLFRGERTALSIARQAGPVPALEQLRANTSVSFGIDILPGYEPALPASFTRLVGSGRADVLRLLGVDYALLSAPHDPAAPPPAALEPARDPFPGSRLYRVKDPLPRAYVALTATAAKDSAYDAAFVPEVLAGARALVSNAAHAFAAGGAVARGRCRLDRHQSDRLEATCTSPARGLAVFIEQWAPGWAATVDGKPAQLVRANFVCRAVPLPPGTHRVVLRYAPPGLLSGALISLLSALLLSGLLWLTRARRGDHAASRPLPAKDRGETAGEVPLR